jgi:hypothetical protein
MSLVKSQELFGKDAFPITVDTVVDRTLIQKELHRHEYFEMLFVEKGSLINRFKSEELVMKTGDVLIMKPYVLHVLENVMDRPARKAYCPTTVSRWAKKTISASLPCGRKPRAYRSSSGTPAKKMHRPDARCATRFR